MMLCDANPSEESVPQLAQEYLFIPQTVRLCYLHFLLKEHFEGDSCIIFAPTVHDCHLVNAFLVKLKFPSVCLHSLQSQRHRLAALGKFRGGKATILVATDVASRGLDIPMVAVVINLGLPRTVDTYIHHIGRTARAGR